LHKKSWRNQLIGKLSVTFCYGNTD